MAWDEVTRWEAPKGEVVARARHAGDGECVLCAGPLSHGDWQVTLAKRPGGRREAAHTHCAADAGWTVA